MINPKNDEIKNEITNDTTVAGTDLFADSESFLVELNDSELAQVNGGTETSNVSLTICTDANSGVSLLICT